MNKKEFISKLKMVYVGDGNAFNEIVEDNQKLKNEVVYSKVEIDRLNNKVSELENINEKIGLALNSAENKVDRLNNIIKELSKDVDMWNKKYNEQFDIINELDKYIKENSIYYNTSDGCQWVDQFKVLDKLKELKEGNK